jgi:hypothetical protein
VSKKFVRMLGIALGSSGKSSRSRTYRSPSQRSAPLHILSERSKEQNTDGGIAEKKWCEHCATKIPFDAEFCPNCRRGKPLPEWFLPIIIFAVLFVVIKCSVP